MYINKIPYSIKSLEKSPPALVNHTARPGWERVCGVINEPIDKLDEIIDKYWSLRNDGIINEDIINSDINSPFKENKEYLSKILNYFLFRGSGSKDSLYPAKFILDFKNPLDIYTWEIWGENYINEHWDRFIFSVRSKKGMGKYPNITDIKKKESMDKWVMLCGDKYKGALHVRVK